MYPSDFRGSPRPIRLTLLAALCAVRAAEIIDGLVDLLIALVLKIDTRAERRRVEGELIRHGHSSSPAPKQCRPASSSAPTGSPGL
jgi:hypothetical protein